MGNPEVIRRHLESDLFGVSISMVNVGAISEVAPSLEQAVRLGTDLLVLRVGSDRLSTIHLIESSGGLFCDALLTLRRTVSVQDLVHLEQEPELIVREASESDTMDIRAVGKRAFTDYTSHWHADPRLQSTLSDELYGRWALDLAKAIGPNSRVLVAVSSEPPGIAGFLALLKIEKERWTVPLTAVDSGYRGRGVLSAMLRKGMDLVANQGGSALDYETQITNIPALRVVASAGFGAISSRLTFHLWLDD